MIISSEKHYCFLLSLLLLSLLIFDSCNRPETSFNEKYRPQVHFSTSKNWMDGPSGMVYLNGAYHLFYRYNSEGVDRNPKHWGHAVSADLIHWDNLPVALSPEIHGTIGYGSVVTDVKNTSGFGSTNNNTPLVAIYTYTDYDSKQNDGSNVQQLQGLAYSVDNGITWITYSDNLIIPNPGINDFHDPKVFWYEPAEHWIMVIASEGRVRFYTSLDLKEWDYASSFGFDLDSEDNVWERPDLFELPVTNGSGTKWILTVNVGLSSHKEWLTGFFVGDFNGKTFSSLQTSPYGIDYGKDNYGGSTFNNLPDGRRVLIGWMNNWEYADITPASPWRGSFTIPRNLHLEQMPDYYMLASQPVNEKNLLHGKHTAIRDLEIVQDIYSIGIEDITPHIHFPLLPSEITIRFKTGNQFQVGFAEKFGIKLSNKRGEYILAGYDTFHQKFYIDRTHSTSLVLPEKFVGIHIQQYQIDESGILEMQIILDAASIELFALDGKVVITDAFYPSVDFDKIAIYAENGRIQVEEVSITQLKSIWKY
ncbi:beta-fructofuranosidase [termite gut metagenome]|uniref:Beta-fructofuranosidase n=1 Tax=termite gut metagenome TaxID=433724 RepID=A0A5J4RDG4_9ZZZZ